MVQIIEFLDQKKKDIIRGFLVFLLFYYGAYFQYIPVYLFHLDLQNLSDVMKVLLSSFSSIVISFILFFVYRKDLKKEFHKFRSNFMDCMNTGFVCWMSGLGIMMVTNVIITFVFKAGGANNEKLVQSMIHALPWLMVINAGFLAPFNEEIIFRKTLKDVFGKYKWLFICLSFLLFGGAHVMEVAKVWTDYLYIIPYGALGASFAIAYYKTDTVFTSMVLHMIHNTALILLSLLVL